MQGYAYILTHPGTPAVFYDHIFSDYRSEIASLLSLRNRKEIHCRSEVKVVSRTHNFYEISTDLKPASFCFLDFGNYYKGENRQGGERCVRSDNRWKGCNEDRTRALRTTKRI